MNVQSGIAEVNGTRLYYETAGSGHPLIFVHGFGLDSRMWEDQFEAFAKRYQVVRYDLRGFGQSAVPTAEGYSHAEDLCALLAHLGIAEASVLGLSMGGWIATNFALVYPDKIRALILADSALIGFQWSSEWNRLWAAIQAAEVEVGVEAARQLWLGHPLFAPALEQAEVAARLALIVSDYSGWHWDHSDSHRAIEPPDIQRLDQITSPTLVIIGEHDLSDFQDMATTLQQRIPHANLVRLPGVGHMTNMEAPERFNEVARHFLSALDDGAS